MKIKVTGMLMTIAMLVAMVALPAGAATGLGNHVGVFEGAASVGKLDATCANDGQGSVSGGGLGLPVVHEEKPLAHWRIDVGNAVDIPWLVGSGQLCGDLEELDPPLNLGLGASCVTTKGSDGKGKVAFDDGDIVVSGLSWTATVGGTFVVQGKATGLLKKAPTNDIVAVVQALDQLVVVGCVLKDKTQTQTFNVVAVYAIN